MSIPVFEKKIIAEFNNNTGAWPMNTFMGAGDIDRDGKLDLVATGRDGRMSWFENRGEARWVEHVVDGAVESVECGGSLVDLTGNGWLDIVCGSGATDTIWWWENPGDSGKAWKKYTLFDGHHKEHCHVHDTFVADVTHDSILSLVVTIQYPAGTSLYRIPLPKDPHITPWQGEMIASGLTEALEAPDGQIFRQQQEEGIAVGDIDGDGLNELVVGTRWYKFMDGQWTSHMFATGYVTNKIAIGDVDGDGRNEIVLAEGDPVIYGKTQGGRAGWFKPGKDITALWTEHTLEDGLLDAHTLLLADLCGTGRLDILVGEIGIGSPTRGYRRRTPWILLYQNLGGGQFARHIIDQGTGMHDGLLLDLTGNGKLDLVAKPLHGEHMWDLIVFFNRN